MKSATNFHIKNYFCTRKSKGWIDLNKQREFVSNFAKEMNIIQPSQWTKVSKEQFEAKGGRSILNHYRSSIMKMLENLYPNIEWYKFHFRTRSHTHWKDKTNQKNFLMEIAKEFDISKPKDWLRVSSKQILEKGGRGLLKEYNYSFRNALESYENWKDEDFIRGYYWQDIKNQKEFLDRLSIQLNLKTSSDWAKKKDFEERSALGFWQLYNGVIMKALQVVYPEIDLDPRDFDVVPKRYWQDVSNQRKFLDRISKELNIKYQHDWFKWSVSKLEKYGVHALLFHYKNSLFNALQTIYPEYYWDALEFDSIPRRYWQETKNQRKFFDSLVNELGIKNEKDWMKIPVSLVRKKGGDTLLQIFEYDLQMALKHVYPELNWEFEWSTATKPEQLIANILKKFANETVMLKYRHPALLHSKSNVQMELDFWLPESKIAFEYQGVQHYKQTYSSSQFQEQKSRDAEKRAACKKNGIFLLEIPFWWDFTEEQFLSTIKHHKPELIEKWHVPDSHLQVQPFPSSFPLKDREIVMLPENFNDYEIDPTGWWMSEKMDGIRAYWDGNVFYSRNGDVISFHDDFKSNFPSITLDGELWIGRKKLHLLKEKLKSENYKDVKYYVFDAPSTEGTFESRLKKLQNVKGNNENVVPVHFSLCKGKDHLLSMLDDIIAEGGEGIILRKPNSNYEYGRSQNMITVKPRFLDKATVVSPNRIASEENAKYWVVKNTFGHQFSLRQRVSTQKYPNIKEGSVITYSFYGFTFSGIPRYPVLYDLHDGVSWQNVISYSLQTNSTSNECYGCSKMIGKNELRVCGKESIAETSESLYRKFHFCPNSDCIYKGIEKLDLKNIEYPPFRNQVGIGLNFEENRITELNNCGFQLLKQGGSYLVNFEYYII